MGAPTLVAPVERSSRRAPPELRTQRPELAPDDHEVSPGVPQFLESRSDASALTAAGPDATDTQALQQVDSQLARSGEALDAALDTQAEEPEAPEEPQPEPLLEPAPAPHHGPGQSEESPPAAAPLEMGERGGGGAGSAGQGEGGAAGEAGDGGESGPESEVGETRAPEAGTGAGGGEDGAGGEGGGGRGGGGGVEEGAGVAAGGELESESAAAGTLEALASGDIALIDEELAEHQRWGAASARVGAAGSARRADFILDQAGGGALGGLGHGALMGAAVGAGSQALEIGAGRLVARLAGPALARSFPLPAIGAVIGGVFSAYDLATRDWGQSGETIGRFGEGGSIYEQLANSIAAVSEIIGIATAVLNVIAGVIGAISIAMWVITVLTVGVASPLAATLSTIAMAIGLATMVLDGINALVLQRLVTLFRALHTFTSQADPSDVEQQGGRIAAAAGASAGFVGGMAGGLAGGGATAAGARRLGIGHAPPHVAGVEPPRPAAGEGPTITADPPPAVEGGVPGGDRPAMLPPEPTMPHPAIEPGVPAVDPHAPTMPAPAPVDPHAPTMPAPTPVDPHAPTMPAPAPVDPHAPTMPAPAPVDPHAPTMPMPEIVDPHAPTALPPDGGMPEIPGPPRVPEFEPLPDYGPELPDWNPGERSPYAPTQLPPPPEVITPSRAPTEPAPRPITDSGPAGTPPAGSEYHPQGWVPPEVDVPPPGHVSPAPEVAPGAAPELRNPAEAFVPDQPAVGENWMYNEPVPDRASVGTNVQRDHVIAQAKLRDMTEGPPDARAPAGALRPIDQRKVATVLAETGAATPARPALPHTEVTFHGPNADVPQITGLRARGGPEHISTDVVGPSREARIAAGYPESAVDRGWVDQLGTAGEQYRLGEVNEALAGLERAEGRPVTPDTPVDTVALGRELDAAFPSEPASPGAAAREPPVWAVRDPLSGEPRPATGAEVMDAIARDRRGEAAAPGDAVLVPADSVAPRGGGREGGPTPPAGGAPRPVAEPRASAEGGAPTRGTTPLTPQQFAEFAAMAEQMGVPREQIQQVTGPTAYLPGSFDQILIGPDILPLAPEARPQGLANPANAALEPRAVLGHEIIGHREAELAGQARIEPWHEEFQASTRAALHTPELPRDQMWLLTQDAAARRRHQSREGTIFVDTERYDPAPRGGAAGGPPPRGASAERPPPVIVDPALAGARRVGDASPALQRQPSPAQPVASPYPSIATLAASSAAARATTRGASSTSTDGAPRDAETARSAGFARTARAVAVGSVDPLASMAWGAYFGHGTRTTRISRGGSVGALVGGVGGGPLGAYVGQRVGEGVARRAEDFNAGLQRGAEPVVEAVNPAYPPPPGSGSRQEIADMQNSLLGILQARAQAEKLQGMMAGDAAHHEANAAPLTEFNQRNGQAISATQAHQQATARRTAANQQQQQQEGSVTGTLQDYGNRAAGLAMITGPLEAFTRFTYLAHALPDSPDVLRGAKRGILKMNSDGQNFLRALSGVDSAVAAQQTGQPARSSGIAANAGRLGATASGGVAAQAGLAQSGGQGQALAARNAARSADSRQREAEAAQTGAQLDTQAEDTRTRIATLSEQWQSWATAHRQARADAMARTRAAMVERGWRPREESAGGGGS